MIHLHYRGHGKSDIPTDLTSVSIDRSVKDLQGILSQLGLKQALFCGHSMGVQIGLEYLRLQPDQVAGLLLLCGSYEFPIHTWHAAKDPSFPHSPIKPNHAKGFSLYFQFYDSFFEVSNASLEAANGYGLVFSNRFSFRTECSAS